MTARVTESNAVPAYNEMVSAEVADFRERYQRYLLILTLTLAWFTAVRQAISPNTWLVNIASLVCLLVAYVLGFITRRRAAVSLTLCFSGLALGVAFEVIQHPGSPAIFLYAPLVVLISAVASTPVLVVSGILCAIAVAALSWGGYVTSQMSAGAAIALLSVTVCAYIASRPIFDSLAMALSSAQDALQVRDELREQRRQLAQSVKALDDALYRLGRLNTSLIIARQQAEEARQLKVRFANMISHEIRTPLNIIISFSEVIANAPESYGMRDWPAHLRGDVDEIYRSGKHLLSLINDVLDLAQVEANRVVLKKERGSILEVIDQAIGLAGKWFNHAGLYLRTEVIGDVPDLQFDRIRIRQVILNLLSNARHYTAVGGVIVRVQHTDEEIVVSVKDTGTGISAPNLQHLFDEFMQPGHAVDESVGSGLGLSISRMFIQLHGGRMWAESAGLPGQGTTVSFSLPLPTFNVASELPPSTQDAEFWQSRYDQARSERVILAASDNSSILQMASRVFNNQGKIVTCSLGGVVQVLPIHQPDVVLLFTSCDDRTNQAVTVIEQLPPNVAVILCKLQTNLEMEARPALETQDVSNWLLKPVTRDELAGAIYAVAPNAHKILSLEDDLTMARFYELSVSGDKRFVTLPTFVNVTRASEVMPLLDASKPDVMLLDINLSEGSGWDVLAKVRARWARDELPIIVVTAMDRYGLPVLRASEVVVRRGQSLSQRETVINLQNMLEAMLG